MTMKKGQNLSKQEIDSINIAVEEASITAIHPDRMEAYADYLVRRLNEQEESKSSYRTSASKKS